MQNDAKFSLFSIIIGKIPLFIMVKTRDFWQNRLFVGWIAFGVLKLCVFIQKPAVDDGESIGSC